MVHFLIFTGIVYLISTFLGYLSHKLFHQKWAGFASKSHMVHHLERYPTDDLISEKYRHAGKNTTILLFVPIVVAALMLTGLMGYLGVISPTYSLIGVVEILLISYLHNALHDAFHVEKSFWHKLPGFKTMRDIHFEHHFYMQKDFGIFDFMWDKVFGTFKTPAKYTENGKVESAIFETDSNV